METSLQTKITAGLTKLAIDLRQDTKSNTGARLCEAFIWQTVAKIAKAQLDSAWASLEKDGLIGDVRQLAPGEHALLTSSQFVANAKVTNPVKRFDANALATMLNKGKYKVPTAVVLEAVEKAKVPGSPQVTKTVAEKA